MVLHLDRSPEVAKPVRNDQTHEEKQPMDRSTASQQSLKEGTRAFERPIKLRARYQSPVMEVSLLRQTVAGSAGPAPDSNTPSQSQP